jgi:hypothetical protein
MISDYENLARATFTCTPTTGSYDMGMFAQHTNGARVLLAESGVDGGYSGGRFTHTQGTGRFTVTLADTQIARSGAFTTAWRTATIGSTATIVESTLVDDVAPASKISDTSWIKPGIAAWPWLDGMVRHAARPDQAQAVGRLRLLTGLAYILVDSGWKGVQSIIPELVNHARARGVQVMLWYHWQDLDTAAERDAEFTKITGWDVVGVKIDFMGSEAQARHQWYDAALADTARYKLMVDLHGSRLSVGVHRTWPRVLTNEAIRGEEYPGGRNIGHVAALPFTRGLLGPSDYAEIIRWPGKGTANQRFAFVPLGDGYTRIVNQASGKDIVIRSASRDAGAKVIQYPYEANANTNDEWLAETRATAVSGSSTATAVSTSPRATARVISWSNARSTAPTTKCSPFPDATEEDRRSHPWMREDVRSDPGDHGVMTPRRHRATRTDANWAPDRYPTPQVPARW